MNSQHEYYTSHVQGALFHTLEGPQAVGFKKRTNSMSVSIIVKHLKLQPQLLTVLAYIRNIKHYFSTNVYFPHILISVSMCFTVAKCGHIMHFADAVYTIRKLFTSPT